MLFPHFTRQEITIDGSWHGDDRQFRFTGTFSSSAPFVLLSLLRCSDAYHYTKHSKSEALIVPINLYQGKFPHHNRYQHSLMIEHSVNTGTVSEGRLCLADGLPMTFQAGQLFGFGTSAQNQTFIYLLAIAKLDIKSKRCGIWAVKPRLLDGVEEPWLHVLSRTRYGFIHIGNSAR